MHNLILFVLFNSQRLTAGMKSGFLHAGLGKWALHAWTAGLLILFGWLAWRRPEPFVLVAPAAIAAQGAGWLAWWTYERDRACLLGPAGWEIASMLLTLAVVAFAGANTITLLAAFAAGGMAFSAGACLAGGVEWPDSWQHYLEGILAALLLALWVRLEFL